MDRIGLKDLTPANAAFVRRIKRTLRDEDPSYAFVVLGTNETGERYQPFMITRANRADLVFAAAQLLLQAIDLESAQACICPHCDALTARARVAVQALGVGLESQGAN